MPVDASNVVHEVLAQKEKEQSDGADTQEQTTQNDVDPEKQDTPGPLLKIPDAPPPRNIHYRTPPSTPSMRTGPPRTLSYVYSLPNSPAASRTNSKHENDQQPVSDMSPESKGFASSSPSSDFRGALEVASSMDRKGKKRDGRESWFTEDSWNLNPMKWFHDSPKEEQQGFEFGAKPEEGPTGQETPEHQTPQSAHPDAEGNRPKVHLRRSHSVPHSGSQDKHKTGAVKWGRLRSLMPTVAQNQQPTPGPSAVTSHKVNITDELITGGLSTLMLRLWFERDEKDHRRVPILFHRLRIRISDSLHPLHGSKSVFRIECEYANGAARWVIYRQLRDLISLHTHYSVSNVYNRNVDNMPEFPRTSLPYFKFLKKEGKEKGNRLGQADFARIQREVLENYLLDLIRAVMFHPASNRLAAFLETSALSISLAPSGGSQAKAGYLHIEAADNKGFGRKNSSWKARREAKWCSVRESFLVAVEEPGELAIWDVFLLDSDFVIERPKRYYRKGLKLLHHDAHSEQGDEEREFAEHDPRQTQSDSGAVSRMGTIKNNLKRTFSRDPRRPALNGQGPGHEHHDDGDDTESESDSDESDNPPTPMLDPSTNANPLTGTTAGEHDENESAWQAEKKKKRGDVSKHTFFISNSQMRLKLYAKNQRQMLQWITALERVAATSHFTGKNRFDSFAPIRLNVAAQWLVDGRDYFWNLSRAILLAKECIFIHDWWISPELQLRRPDKDRYRLDRLLERKAKEGVKIYIILYQEVTNRTTPIDSNYTKQRLMSLHPNIMVQRSPSHFQTGTFYWAHHEKMCVIDQAIVFMGGLDLCFGRWDTPQHVLSDDQTDTQNSEIWPGKDYNNPRVLDFHTLNKPEEDLYDRAKVPRMPWHDVAMQVVGQPARDLARHFVQRWNWLLRNKNHKRVMPFLLPPPEFKPGELTQLGLTGTCEMQICRSAGPWSIGTPTRIEHSIQNAYLKAIQMSEHFVYIENQFFITSTTVNDVKIENKIGDALVHRIIRAHRDGTPWKCCIMIPLLPGFTYPVDHSDASAVRIILECQNRTIAGGPNSIYARLRKEGIDPENYICVFSLRNWAKMKGDTLTTEQVYIHGKVCIVDDRLAIIGSANINERSQRGDRDSEIAAVVRDTDMIDGVMAGKPFKVGRFAHTLRVRLMREHVGVDVDSLYEEDLMTNEPPEPEYQQEAWDPNTEQEYGQRGGVTKVEKSSQSNATKNMLATFNTGAHGAAIGAGEATSHLASRGVEKTGVVSKDTAAHVEEKALEEERQTFTRDGQKVPGFASSVVPTLEEKIVADGLINDAAKAEQSSHLNGSAQVDGSSDRARSDKIGDSAPEASVESSQPRTKDGELFGAPADASRSPQTDDQPPHARSGVEDADEEEKAAPGARATIRRHLGSKLGSKAWQLLTPKPDIDPHGFNDPVAESFWKDVWVAAAVHNTEIFRKVFHAIPDDLVTTWKQYKEFVLHHERLNKPARDSATPEPVGRVPSETADENAPGPAHAQVENPDAHSVENNAHAKDGADSVQDPSGNVASNLEREKTKRSARTSTEPFEKWERDEMERLLKELSGHLVIYPTRFLEGEDAADNFLFNADRLLPLPIYD